MPAFRARVAAICAPLPGAAEASRVNGEIPSWKVGGKMFAVLGSRAPGVSVRCADAETAAMLIEAGAAARAPYLNATWVRLAESVGDDDLRHRLVTSYDLIRAALPAALRRTLERA